MSKIWIVSQDDNDDYDTYDSFVCVAPDEETARRMFPDYELQPTGLRWSEDGTRREFFDESNHTWKPSCLNPYSDWALNLNSVTAVCVGTADDPTPRVLLASFNAG